MYNPGRNKTRVEFYDRSETKEVENENGEYEQKHKLICVDWVELIPQTGREFVENRKDESAATYRFKMRRRNDIETEDYVIFNGIKAEIIQVLPYIDYTMQNRFIEVVVEWRT